MTKKFYILCFIGLSLFLNGCAVKPEVTITDYFTEIQSTTLTNFDSLNNSKYFDSEIVLSDDNQELNLDNTESNEMTDKLIMLIKDFDYTIKETVIDGDNATVNVEILTYPIGELYANYITQLFSKAFEWAFSGISEEEMTQKTSDLFIELADNLEKTYTKTVPVYLVKVEDKWLMVGDEKNTEFFNALTGGLIDFAKQYQNTDK